MNSDHKPITKSVRPSLQGLQVSVENANIAVLPAEHENPLAACSLQCYHFGFYSDIVCYTKLVSVTCRQRHKHDNQKTQRVTILLQLQNYYY